MNFKSFLKGGSMAVVAAALALPPVAAQAQDGRQWRERSAEQRNDAGERAARQVIQHRERVARERDGNRGGWQQPNRGDDRRDWQRPTPRPDSSRDRDRDNYRDRDRDRNGREWGNRDRSPTPGWRGNDNRSGNDRWRYDNRGRDYREAQRRWDRNWRNDNRYDWNRYRQSNRNLYRPGRYSAPYSNYGYRRLNIGISLNSLFYSSRYWINDPWQYRLPAAYGPYRWVRYYDDVLLVDTYSGQVVDVIYDFFW